MSWEAASAMEKNQILNSEQGSNSISTVTEWCLLPAISVARCDIRFLGDT